MVRFTEGELEVMQVLWEHGCLKPAQIQERFPRRISNMALCAVLRVLLDKGHVTRRRDGKAYFYQAKTLRRAAMKKMTRKMADLFAGGSPFALIAQMIKSEDLSKEHVEELRRLASEKTGEESSREEDA